MLLSPQFSCYLTAETVILVAMTTEVQSRIMHIWFNFNSALLSCCIIIGIGCHPAEGLEKSPLTILQC